MLEAFTIGPLLIATRPTAVVVALALAVWGTGYLAARAGLNESWARGVAEGTAWLGLLGARLGYVIASWSAFRAEPWTALYLWQPGYLPYTGIVLGAAYAFWRIWSQPPIERWVSLRALGTGYAGAGIALGAALLTLSLIVPSHVLRVGSRVPDFALVDLSGDTVRLSDLAGHGVILNFWATWCPPCRREMPLLDAFQSEYASQGLIVVGIDLDESVETVAPFIITMGSRYRIWLDPGPARPAHDRVRAIYDLFGGVGLPTTVFIDRNGSLLDTHVGELNRAILEESVTTLLAF